MAYKLKVSTNWRARRRLLKPGDYLIPEDISLSEARCCEVDGAGYIDREGEKQPEPFQEPEAPAPRQRRKAAAPENKSRRTAPENKSEVVE